MRTETAIPGKWLVFIVEATTLLEQCAARARLVLVAHEGTSLRPLRGLAPPRAAVFQALGFPPAARYVS